MQKIVVAYILTCFEKYFRHLSSEEKGSGGRGVRDKTVGQINPSSYINRNTQSPSSSRAPSVKLRRFFAGLFFSFFLLFFFKYNSCDL